MDNNETFTVGATFNTPFETGCRVVTMPGTDQFAPNNFLALDSEGVECEFSAIMVIGHPDYVQL